MSDLATPPNGNTYHLMSLPPQLRKMTWEMLVSRKDAVLQEHSCSGTPIGFARSYETPAPTYSSPAEGESNHTRYGGHGTDHDLNTFRNDLTVSCHDRLLSRLHGSQAYWRLQDFTRIIGADDYGIRRVELAGNSTPEMRSVRRGREQRVLKPIFITYTITIEDVSQSASTRVISRVGGFAEEGCTSDSVQWLRSQLDADKKADGAIRSETPEMFYSTNTFTVQFDSLKARNKTVAWINSIGSTENLTTRFEVVGIRRNLSALQGRGPRQRSPTSTMSVTSKTLPRWKSEPPALLMPVLAGADMCTRRLHVQI
ncbi:hypothetical protein DOTSEDRAFT_23924 [Dothistroma septosporum NZE10]|uniref:Uncharacterized protein n=1 Tax=Dothistroma septosporum (strain NZE10 / CBS 128990) TaxID=675120 RepID=N1PMZ9_DOTSN|nr:hypothetical protein DOTSEDRAFT_23924 [Dothistroma septosporum NZE10]